MNFPKTIFVTKDAENNLLAHHDEIEAVDDDYDVIEVGEYKLVGTKKLRKTVTEVK